MSLLSCGLNAIKGKMGLGGNQIQYDSESDDRISDSVKRANNEFESSKNKPPVINIPPTTHPSTSKPSSGKGGSSDGLNAPMIVRNPDSIIREVSISLMKASL